MPKHPGGRPPKLTKLERQEVWDALERFIDIEDDPAVVYFVAYDPTALKYRITRENIRDWAEFSQLEQRSIAKQEAYLVNKGTKGRLNQAMVIFRLKQPQHGFRDRQDHDLTTNGKDLPTPILGGASAVPTNNSDEEAA